MNLQEAWDFYGGLTLRDVARKLGVSEPFVSQVLSGKRSSSQVTTEIRMKLEQRIRELKDNLCPDTLEVGKAKGGTYHNSQ